MTIVFNGAPKPRPEGSENSVVLGSRNPQKMTSEGRKWHQVHLEASLDIFVYMGGCQNHGPFLGPFVIWHLVFRGPNKGP